ncbi:MAG: stalk domain-containing protein [Fimbriimonas sp.]
MMNRFTKGGALAALFMTAAMSGAQSISVNVDGDRVDFRGTEPAYINGRVLVPLRGVFEQMGASVNWRPATRTVTARKGDKDVRLRIGERTASIDGQPVTMDVPAQIIDGSTMVPIRFLSESLGADVSWNSSERLVMIDSSGTGRAQGINRDRDRDWNRNRDRDRDRTTSGNRTQILQNDTVLPVRLDTSLSSNESRAGDAFTATVGTDSDSSYGFLPAGTRVEGKVLAARRKQGNNPGVIELDFQRLRLPNGRTYPIDGQLISLDSNSVTRDSDGTIRAKSGSSKDNRTVYAGYGAGAGLVVGLLTKKPLEGALLGGILGYLAGESQRGQNRPSDVRLTSGTEFGVRLTQDVAIRQRDIQ